jgi:SNF2 family DNA or RNA helicase
MAWIDLDEDGFLAVRCEYEEREVVKTIGGRWDTFEKVWNVAFTISNLTHLLDNLTNPGCSEAVESRAATQSDKEKSLRDIRTLSKSDTPVRLRVPGLKLTLRNYQKLGVMFGMTNSEGVLIADEMGLGKTAQAIATAMFLKQKRGATKILVITPASLKWNWPLEIEKFTNEPYIVIDGVAKKRIPQWLRDDAFFYVVNYELVTEDLFGGKEYKLIPKKDGEKPDERRKREEKNAKTKEKIAKVKKRMRILGPVRRRKWDLIIVDEVHALKTHYAKRTQHVKELRARMRLGLSGTPMDGKLEELHSVMGFVAPGLLESRTRFMQKHAACDMYGKVIRYRHVDKVRHRIEPYFIRRLKRDVLAELPDKVYLNRMVVMNPRERKTYDELAENGHAATQDAEAMVTIIRCKQWCDHPELIDRIAQEKDPNAKRIMPRRVKSSKMMAFREVLQEVVIMNGNKALIFTQYSHMAELLLEELDEMGLKYLYIWGGTPKKDRAAMQERFNTDKTIDVMVGTEAMSTGLNFTAATYVVNYDDNWAPAIMAQREDRAHRMGQKDTVTVINFICYDTIEERIRKVLYVKGSISSQTLGDGTDMAVLKRLGPQDIAKML